MLHRRQLARLDRREDHPLRRRVTLGRVLDAVQREVLAWFIKAWNAWRQGKKIKILRHKSGEAFPEAI